MLRKTELNVNNLKLKPLYLFIVKNIRKMNVTTNKMFDKNGKMYYNSNYSII